MNDQLAKIGEWLGNVAPGGVMRTRSGVKLNVSSNGTTSIPASSLENIIFKRFEEMHAAKLTVAAPEEQPVIPAVPVEK